jgi:hypothetical protein
MESPPSDLVDKILISFITTRSTPDPDYEKHREFLQNNFGATNITFSFLCDICDKDGLTREQVFSKNCSNCNKYYDFCKSHENVIDCPFCNPAGAEGCL